MPSIAIFSIKCMYLLIRATIVTTSALAPEQPRLAGFGGSEPRVGCNYVSSPLWLMIRRLWAMLLPSSMMPLAAKSTRRRKRTSWSCLETITREVHSQKFILCYLSDSNLCPNGLLITTSTLTLYVP